MKITSFTLKIIAIISMLIDHTTVALYYFIPTEMNYIYDIGRGIGRIAFPLFCFMIVEGLYHTRNKWRYLGSLTLLAFISELPFDSLFSDNGFQLEYNSQNVFFTLAMGLLMVILLDATNKRMKAIIEKQEKGVNRFEAVATNVVIQILIIQFMYMPMTYIKSDYGSFGLDLILYIYYFEKIPGLFKKFNEKFESDKVKFIFAGLAVLLWLIEFDVVRGRLIESPGFPAVILIMLYNGKRGNYKIPKYVFYFFYPIHLILLYFIRKALFGYFGISGQW